MKTLFDCMTCAGDCQTNDVFELFKTNTITKADIIDIHSHNHDEVHLSSLICAIYQHSFAKPIRNGRDYPYGSYKLILHMCNKGKLTKEDIMKIDENATKNKHLTCILVLASTSLKVFKFFVNKYNITKDDIMKYIGEIICILYKRSQKALPYIVRKYNLTKEEILTQSINTGDNILLDICDTRSPNEEYVLVLDIFDNIISNDKSI